MSPDDPTTEPQACLHGALFEQFAQRLIGLARLHLDARLQHKVDPEDVVQSVYKPRCPTAHRSHRARQTRHAQIDLTT